MAREPQGRSNITVLVAATVGALVIVALNDLALAASGWSVKVFVLLAGVLAGVSARAADRAAAARLATHVGVITLGVVIVGDVILGVLAVGDPTVALDWQTAAWALGAGLLARLVADGFEPFGLLTGTSSARLAPGKEHLRGTRECPQCGSLQTEPVTTDIVTGAPSGYLCNACDHRWQ